VPEPRKFPPVEWSLWGHHPAEAATDEGGQAPNEPDADEDRETTEDPDHKHFM